MPRVEYCLKKRSLAGHEEECGDTGVVVELGDNCFFALVDGVGHGHEACAAARVAESYLMANCGLDLVEMMKGLHGQLGQTRGAVAALCRLHVSSGVLRYVGIGNITVRIFGDKDYRLVSRDGIIGYMMATPREVEEKLHPGDLMVLSSDGVKEHFDPYEYPGLLTGSPREIAASILSRLGKDNDDASCLVLRYSR